MQASAWRSSASYSDPHSCAAQHFVPADDHPCVVFSYLAPAVAHPRFVQLLRRVLAAELTFHWAADRRLVHRSLKYILSFFKANWTLDDYPVRLRFADKPDLPFGPGLKPTPWIAHIEGWWLLSGGGDTREEAMADLRHRFEKYRAQHSRLPRPGARVPIPWVPSDRISKLQPLADEFLQRVFGRKTSQSFISNESTLHHFTFGHPVESIVQRIREEFGVEVSDIEHLNMAAILERIAEKRAHKSHGEMDNGPMA